MSETQVSDLKLYDYFPYRNRPRIAWPGGARIAVWVAPNIEFYEFDPPNNPKRKPWARPHPDVLAYSHRDYGNRAGWQRMMRAMDETGFRGSVSLNVAMCDHHPEIIKACADRGWEFFSHGIYNTRYVYGMTREEERGIVVDSRETIKKWTGQSMDGWLSPALSNNPWSLDVLAEEGVRYTCDLFHDDQPTPVHVSSGRLISVPYSLEMNDTIVYNVNLFTPRHYGEIIKRQFDQLYAEGAQSGTVMCIPLHPYLVGQPHRIDAFAEALAYIAGHEGVWLATGREIAQHYYDHHYDTVAQAIAAVQ
ncbi:polysaccharide deacetylase family protein [Pusillimonas noertemannii]|uniref:Peptidoglycan/xylan/chitin deacetylase (PgdA/CDA1 family) n=1 Tax=Pusillimonas noertemannii TaxID=305977 RepID=A0A2U1CN23_9BURK|nr:polysaccharide deacetylase family protein [Pusillimonas noertemannii]NYT68573.1 polysaccharide deacetylase family protein [Pusillimonas noertemannii]PVY62410.1 peptidoglycan/xylan/chitin deacetylase (PgdA/CDA1 family) [Pusillimonas noertemannii]TFL10627.1 polysaccharide deacetylase [Pusillimonas noertemannii]